jgi:hypothetical protein
MTRALGLLAVVALCSLDVPPAFGGEDPVRGVVSATGPGVSVGCVDTAGDTVAFQCVGCRIRYRLLSDSQYAAGNVVPTDGGPLLDGGTWGPIVDFTVNPDPYRAQSRYGQSKICFYAEDAGSVSLSNRVEVFGSY